MSGEYLDDKLINLGANRFAIRPQSGVVHTRGMFLDVVSVRILRRDLPPIGQIIQFTNRSINSALQRRKG